MKESKILTFYNKKQVCFDGIEKDSYSKSPLKPYLLLKKIKKDGYGKMLEINGDFQPFERSDFYLAHKKKYVDNVFEKRGNYNSNSVPWSKNLVESLTYTNSSLYNAIRHAIENPSRVTFSPTSGFHHAQPKNGSGFCTFSGQVIASTKIYRELGMVGCYLDLDGHFGNSIEDSRTFVKDLDFSVPVYANINPVGTGDLYVEFLQSKLKLIEKAILKNKIHYLVWCHGADSHEDDDLGHQCSTKHWLKCSDIFYNWVNQVEEKVGRPIPVTLALFGGYRKDDYNSVLSLHMNDLIKCSNILCGRKFEEKIEVKDKPKPVAPVFEKAVYERTQTGSWKDDDFFYESSDAREFDKQMELEYKYGSLSDESFEAFEANEMKKNKQPKESYSTWQEWYKSERDKKRIKLFGVL